VPRYSHPPQAGRWQADDEGCTLADFGLEGNGPAVLIHYYRARDGKSLTGAFAHAFGGEERFKDPVPDFSGMPAPLS